MGFLVYYYGVGHEMTWLFDLLHTYPRAIASLKIIRSLYKDAGFIFFLLVKKI
jgi:hypothetical protein